MFIYVYATVCATTSAQYNVYVISHKNSRKRLFSVFLFVCLCWSFTAQSTRRSCRAGQLIVALFLGRLRPYKQLTSTKQGRPRQ